MSYEVGTHINLAPTKQTVKRGVGLYAPGTKFYFLKLMQNTTVLKITNNPLALNTHFAT